MAQVRTKKNVGPSGLAAVRVLKHGLRVEFKDGDTYDIDDKMPDNRPGGTYIVSLSQDKSRILGLRPPAGQYILQFKQMGNRTQGRGNGPNGPLGLPTNKIQPGHMGTRKDGRTFFIPDQLVYTVELEVVTKGIYEGLSTSTNMPYLFARPAQGEFTDYVDSPKNVQNTELFFKAATGKLLSEIDITFADDPTTLLLRYEKFIKDNSEPFLGTIGEKGFLDLGTLSPLPPEFRSMVSKTGTKKPVKKAKKS